MLSTLMRAANWSHLAVLNPTNALRVIPPHEVLRVGARVLLERRDRRAFMNLVDQRQRSPLLRQLSIETRAEQTPHNQALTPADEIPDDLRTAVGHQVLSLYFWQLYADSTALLDLRSRRFFYDHEAGRLLWYPGPTHWRWSAGFLDALRKLYLGYFSDDRELLCCALERLRLDGAEDIFAGHFGAGPKESQRFELETLLHALSQVIARCADRRVRLGHDFVALTYYLTGLYELLEALDVEIDAAAVFASVTSDDPAATARRPKRASRTGRSTRPTPQRPQLQIG